MKTYNKPTTEIFEVKLTSHLMEISGGAGAVEIKGGSNGDYSSTGGITLGSRRGGTMWDEDEE